jgi:TetR/AcrR family transcriptional regulator, transcriptional repressor for nem operon
MGNDTKNKLLLHGIEVLQSKGFHGMGLAEVLSVAEVPKGSFYHYFKSKEDFVAECLSVYWAQAKEHMLTIANNPSLNPRQQLDQLFCVTHFEKLECHQRKGCLLGKLASETPAIGGVVVEQINRGMAEWAEIILRIITLGQIKGEFNSSIPALSLTHFMMDAWEGALINMRISGSLEALHRFQNIVFNNLLIKP